MAHSVLIVGQFDRGGHGRGVERVVVADDGSEYPSGSGRFPGPLVRCDCGRLYELRRVHGKYRPDKKCSARCQSATGSSCECACAGKNHGAAYG